MAFTFPRTVEDAVLLGMSVARLGRGLVVLHPATRPALPVELFDMEGCPYCRKVREALSELDLDYVARTCGRGAKTRELATAVGQKRQFPLLSDPNTGKVLYESEDIIDHLWATYGPGRPRWDKALRRVSTAGSALVSAFRWRGYRVPRDERARVQPPALPVLYNFEASPWCRKVREVMNELDLHHHVKNVAKRSPHRAELMERGGKMRVPYLIDPNTGVELYESAAIIAYLRRTYGASGAG